MKNGLNVNLQEKHIQTIRISALDNLYRKISSSPSWLTSCIFCIPKKLIRLRKPVDWLKKKRCISRCVWVVTMLSIIHAHDFCIKMTWDERCSPKYDLNVENICPRDRDFVGYRKIDEGCGSNRIHQLWSREMCFWWARNFVETLAEIINVIVLLLTIVLWNGMP